MFFHTTLASISLLVAVASPLPALGGTMAAPKDSQQQLATATTTQNIHPLLQQAAASDTLPRLIAYRVKRDLANRLNIPISSIVIDSSAREVWPDSCLGLPQPIEHCRQKEVKGWQIKVLSPQQHWVYRSDRVAHRLHLESPTDRSGHSSGAFSFQLSQSILETASQETNEPISNLHVLQVMPTLWQDDCLGLPTPDRVCMQATVSGFRVIVADSGRDNPHDDDGYNDQPELLKREWVYHLTADGSQIVQNAAASDVDGPVSIFLSDPEQAFLAVSELNSSPIIAQMKAESFIDGGEIYYTLTADGKITYQNIDREGNSYEQVFQQISRENLDRFKELLVQSQLEHFNNLSYVNTSPYVAIDGGTAFSAKGASVNLRYSDVEELPNSLQAVIEVWTRMVL